MLNNSIYDQVVGFSAGSGSRLSLFTFYIESPHHGSKHSVEREDLGGFFPLIADIADGGRMDTHEEWR